MNENPCRFKRVNENLLYIQFLIDDMDQCTYKNKSTATLGESTFYSILFRLIFFNHHSFMEILHSWAVEWKDLSQRNFPSEWKQNKTKQKKNDKEEWMDKKNENKVEVKANGSLN